MLSLTNHAAMVVGKVLTGDCLLFLMTNAIKQTTELSTWNYSKGKIMKVTSLGFNPNLGAEFMKRYNGRVISFGRSFSKSSPSSEPQEASNAVHADPAVGAVQVMQQRFGKPSNIGNRAELSAEAMVADPDCR